MDSLNHQRPTLPAATMACCGAALLLLLAPPLSGQEKAAAKPKPAKDKRVVLGPLNLDNLGGKVVCVYNLSTW